MLFWGLRWVIIKQQLIFNMEGLDYDTESNSDMMSQVISFKFTMNYFNYFV